MATYNNETLKAMLTNEKDADKPADYSAALIENQANLAAYLASEERAQYIEERAQYCSSVFLAFNMTQEENVKNIVNALSSFGVTKEKYDSFGYTYAAIKNLPPPPRYRIAADFLTKRRNWINSWLRAKSPRNNTQPRLPIRTRKLPAI